MNDDQESPQTEQPAEDPADTEKSPAAEAEFKVKVRKLDLPVRPRGVLAE